MRDATAVLAVETDLVARALAQGSASNVLRDLDARLPPTSRPYVIGGALRDLLRGASDTMKDIDVVVDGIGTDVLRACIEEARINFFGGLTYTASGTRVDVWPLAETYHIKQFGLAPTIENLLAGAPFNLDKIVFDLRNGVLTELGAVDGIARRRIAYAPLRRYLEHVQALRCVLLRQKTGFDLDPSAHDLLVRVARDAASNEDLQRSMRQFLESAYGISDDRTRRDIISRIAA